MAASSEEPMMAASSEEPAMAASSEEPMMAASSEEPAMAASSEEPMMAAAEPKLPSTGLKTDTLSAAGGSATEGLGYVGVWAVDAAACATIDQAGAANFAVITTATYRDGPNASYGNFGVLKDGKLTIKAGARTIAVEQTSPDALTIDGKAYIRCKP